MKRFALVGLSILCLSLATTTSVKAGTRTEQIAMSTTTIVNSPAVKTRITPFALVSLAYQGEYQMQGIPGFGSFESAISDRTITAKDLVKAAIDANQLSPEAQTDRDYLNEIALQLSLTDN
jgi:hypothetical protein